MDVEDIKEIELIVLEGEFRPKALQYLHESQELQLLKDATDLGAELNKCIHFAEKIGSDEYADEKMDDEHYELIKWFNSDYFQRFYVDVLQLRRKNMESATIKEMKSLMGTCSMLFYDGCVLDMALARGLTPGQKEAVIRNLSQLSAAFVDRCGLLPDWIARFHSAIGTNQENNETVHDQKNKAKKRRRISTATKTNKLTESTQMNGSDSMNTKKTGTTGKPPQKRKIATTVSSIDDGNTRTSHFNLLENFICC